MQLKVVPERSTNQVRWQNAWGEHCNLHTLQAPARVTLFNVSMLGQDCSAPTTLASSRGLSWPAA